MSRLTITKTNFTAGEIGPDLYGRADLASYANGAAQIINFDVKPTGGVTRRYGLRHIDRLDDQPARLVPFQFNADQVYLLVFSENQIDVYWQDQKLTQVTNPPWSADQLDRLSFAQSADTLLITHPDIKPQKLLRTGEASWQLQDWSFYDDGDLLFQPFTKFAAHDVTLRASSTSGTVTVTASADVFTPDHIDTHIRIEEQELIIDSWNSATSVKAQWRDKGNSTSETTDWQEQAFSSARGWPAACCFHQDRLVIGGSRDLPNHLFLSKSGDYFNFDPGEGLDDEAIELSLMADQVNEIVAVNSSRHLQIFTTGGEWVVEGDPVIPADAALIRLSREGSRRDYRAAPTVVDNGTLFLSKSRARLMEFLYTSDEQSYVSSNLSLLAPHLCDDPIALAHDRFQRRIYILKADGTVAVLTFYRDEKVIAWAQLVSDGTCRSLTICGENVYFIFERANGVFLERLDEFSQLDSSRFLTFETPTRQINGLEDLNDQTVQIIVNGTYQGTQSVTNGQITLSEPAETLEIGLAFALHLAPLPLAINARPIFASLSPVRLVRASFRLQESTALHVDTGRGNEIVLGAQLGAIELDRAPDPFSGERMVHALGWCDDATQPLWKVEQDLPASLTVLSVNAEIAINA